MTPVFIGLGSNQNDPQVQLDQALAKLNALPATQLIRCSARYWTPPWGDLDQAEFLNAVAEIATGLEPHALLEALQLIESAQGRSRDRQRRWGPRPLDLDVLLYGEQIIDSPGLDVPHRRMHERAFVLLPLVDLEPEITIPGRGLAAQFLANLDTSELRRA